VAHSNRCNFGYNSGELEGEFKWATKMGDMLGAIWMNQVG
jgi:hypothetical protein